MLDEHSNEISQAILNTVLYSDVFDFPLTAREIHRYLHGRAATYEEVCQELAADPRLTKEGQFFMLKGREEIALLRQRRETRSQKLLSRAVKYGRTISFLPFVRMVALTGSLAVHNISGNEDFDYMLVTQPGRLWTARAFVLLFGRFTRRAGYTICPNIILSEESLLWHSHDLYSARDLCQMIPLSGLDVYHRLVKTNEWVAEYLPNACREIAGMSSEEKTQPGHFLQHMLELPWQGSPGDRFERWEMNRKIERFARQERFGEETIFNACICQGNFDHHRRWTRLELEKRHAIWGHQSFSETGPAELKTL